MPRVNLVESLCRTTKAYLIINACVHSRQASHSIWCHMNFGHSCMFFMVLHTCDFLVSWTFLRGTWPSLYFPWVYGRDNQHGILINSYIAKATTQTSVTSISYFTWHLNHINLLFPLLWCFVVIICIILVNNLPVCVHVVWKGWYWNCMKCKHWKHTTSHFSQKYM